MRDIIAPTPREETPCGSASPRASSLPPVCHPRESGDPVGCAPNTEPAAEFKVPLNPAKYKLPVTYDIPATRKPSEALRKPHLELLDIKHKVHKRGAVHYLKLTKEAVADIPCRKDTNETYFDTEIDGFGVRVEGIEKLYIQILKVSRDGSRCNLLNIDEVCIGSCSKISFWEARLTALLITFRYTYNSISERPSLGEPALIANYYEALHAGAYVLSDISYHTLNNLTVETILKNKILNSPVISGVYFLLDKDEIVYIGMSINILYRISGHSREQTKLFDSFSYIPVSPEYLGAAETYLIKRFQPKYNVTDNPGKANGKE
ncbi:MAG: hypothetical protein OEY64_03015 [Nitrospinota bacterium]|nr:hypothetical protein [Nitrospinota bacterium]